MHQKGRSMDLELWTLISFELWCRRFLDSPATSPARAPARTTATTFGAVAHQFS
jgi:hypothetical protein